MKLKRGMKLIRVATVAAVTVACTTGSSPDGAAPTETVTEPVSDDHVTAAEPALVELPTGVFVSSSIDGDHPLGDTPIQLTIDEQHLHVRARCNDISTRYRIEGSYLWTTDSGVSAADCDAELRKQDDWLYGFVANRLLVVVNDGQFVLSNRMNTITFDEV